jgi:hypothetical protein
MAIHLYSACLHFVVARRPSCEVVDTALPGQFGRVPLRPGRALRKNVVGTSQPSCTRPDDGPRESFHPRWWGASKRSCAYLFTEPEYDELLLEANNLQL